MRRLLTFLLLTLSVLAGTMPAGAQGSYVPTLYDTTNGLPQQTINVTIQDKQGYLWFGTSNGFSRFDGAHFTNYRLEDSDSIGIANNLITSLREDSRRYIWLTNDNRRTVRFNPYTRRFFPLPDSLGTVKSLQLLPNGDIWLHLDNGRLVRARYGEGEQLDYETVLDYPPGDDTDIVMVSNDREHHVWILSRREFLDYDEQTGKLTRHPLGTDDRYYSMRKRLNLFQIGSDHGKVYIYRNRERQHSLIRLATTDNIVRIKAYTDTKSLYMTGSDGFFLHDLESGRALHYSASQPAPRRLESNHIGDCYVDQDKNIWVTYLDNSFITCLEPDKESQRRFRLLDRHRRTIDTRNKISIFEDRNQRIWFYAPDKALNYYDMENHELFPLILPATQGMPDFTEPSSLYVDKQRNLWLGRANKGVLKLTFKSNHFDLLSPDPTDLYSNANRTRGLCADSRGNLWMGAQDSTIHLFDTRTRRFRGYFSAQGTITPQRSPVGRANAILEDREGNIWIGTDGSGLFKATPLAGGRYRVERFVHRTDDPASLSDNRVTFLLEDSNGRIWVGTAGNGLNAVGRGAEGQTVFFHPGHRLTHYPAAFRQIRCLCEDGRGRIWIATTQGLLRFRPEQNAPESVVFEDLHTLAAKRGAFNTNSVFFIYRSGDGTLNLATFGKGLFRLSPDGTLANYTTRDGLPSDVLYTMQEDGNGCLWLATEGGLCKFDPQARTFDTFDDRFFPSPLTFSDNDAADDGHGRLIFATDRGLLAFRPGDIEKDTFKPNIVLTAFSANDSPVTDANGQPYTFGNNRTVTLSHDRNSFNLLFRALDMNFPDRLQYAYKLDGFDDWHYVGNEPKAVYTNIPPGDYTFRVRSTNSDGRWMDNESCLHIRVLPSFWGSPGGIALAIVLFLAATTGAGAIVLGHYKLKQRMLLEQKLAKVKTDFFTNIVHEMRTPFTLVVSPLENVLEQPELSPQVRQNLEIMQKNTRRSIRLINQILDFQKVTSGKMHLTVRRVELRAFFEQLLRSFAGLAESEDTRLELQMKAPSLTVWADADKLESVFFNLLSNAFKYSPRGKRITVAVEEHGEHITVRVIDQGYGIPEERQPHLFDRFESFVQRQASRVPTTGIGLSLIKELVELHHGHISVTSSVNNGSTFTVELPKGRDHFDPDTEFILEDGDDTDEPTAPASDTSGEDTDATRPLLLIVEDNAELRGFLESTFSNGYRTLTAANGEEGFLRAVSHNPDLVISDIHMPVLSGTEMFKMLRRNPATSHIPVILLTNESSAEGEVESLNLGVEAYVPKPFSSKVLRAQADNIVRGRRRLQELYRSQFIYPETDATPGDTASDSALPPAEQAFIDRMTEHIGSHLGSPELNVESLAREMGVSRSVLFKKTKALTGLSPVELIRDLRFRKAAELLETGSQTMTEIAFLTGFYDSHYFSKCFKQVYGMSPSEYRKMKNEEARS